MFYLIYKITNIINNKIYVGSHKTKNKDDGYMGSGKYLNYAIKKHGIENFTKEILFEFNSSKEMFDKEAEIVDDDFLAEENTYNLKRGGFGGFDYINSVGLGGKNGHAFTDTDRQHGRNTMSAKSPEERRSILLKSYKNSTKEQRQHRSRGMTLTCNTDAAIASKKETWKKNNRGVGANNSQFGKTWITDGVNNKLVKIDIMPNGWHKGRILK